MPREAETGDASEQDVTEGCTAGTGGELGTGIITVDYTSYFSISAFPGCLYSAFCLHPGRGCGQGGARCCCRLRSCKSTLWDKETAGGGGQRLCARSGSLGVFSWCRPTPSLRASVSPWLQGGRDLTWLPAWPPRFEFLLCACCAARKVLWESKYSSPRRLQPGCSLPALRGAPGEGPRCCRGEDRVQLASSAPRVLSWGSLRGPRQEVAVGGCPPSQQPPGCSASFHRCRAEPRGHGGPPSPIPAGSPLLSPRPRCVLLRRGRSWAGVRGRGVARGAFLTYLPASAEPVGCCPGDSVALRPGSSALRPGCTY